MCWLHLSTTRAIRETQIGDGESHVQSRFFYDLRESDIQHLILAIQHRAVHLSACFLSTNSHDRLMLLVNVVSLLETIDHHPS